MSDQEEIREEDTFFGNPNFIDPFEPYYMPDCKIILRADSAGHIVASDSGWTLNEFPNPENMPLKLSDERKALLYQFLRENNVTITEAKEVEVVENDSVRAVEKLRDCAKHISWIAYMYPDSIVKNRAKALAYQAQIEHKEKIIDSIDDFISSHMLGIFFIK